MKLKEILDGNIESRINAYVYLKKLNQKNNFINYFDVMYINFEERGYDFFKENNLTLNVFDRGKFFQYIKNLSEKENKILIIYNLEIIQNILFNKNEFEEFFKEMQLQKFRNKVIFICSDIVEMKIEKILRDVYLGKNIIIGEQNEN
ncbi:MAG: hypothetical protein ACRC5S_12415 [Cetobacterium sp.]